MQYFRFLFLFFFATFCFFPSFVVAEETVPDTISIVNPIGGTAENPEGVTDIPAILGTILKQATAIIGSLAFVAFLLGGFFWMTSEGSSEKVKMGLDTMVYASIGLLVIFGSYAILSTILKGLGVSDDNVSTESSYASGDESCIAIGNGWQCVNIADTSCDVIVSEERRSLTLREQRELCKNSPDSCRLNKCGGEFVSDDIVCCKKN